MFVNQHFSKLKIDVFAISTEIFREPKTKYQKRISGPLLDRIDLHIEVPSLKIDEITEEPVGMETSAAIRERENA